MRSAAAAWRWAEGIAMIDLDELKRVANLPGDREVVSRRWLRQVLRELRDARGLVPEPLPSAALDFDAYVLGRQRP